MFRFIAYTECSHSQHNFFILNPWWLYNYIPLIINIRFGSLQFHFNLLTEWRQFDKNTRWTTEFGRWIFCWCRAFWWKGSEESVLAKKSRNWILIGIKNFIKFKNKWSILIQTPSASPCHFPSVPHVCRNFPTAWWLFFGWLLLFNCMKNERKRNISEIIFSAYDVYELKKIRSGSIPWEAFIFFVKAPK